MSVTFQSVVRLVQQETPPYSSSPSKRQRVQHVIERIPEKSMDDFLFEVRSLFKAPLEIERLLAYSNKLQAECRERLQKSEISMLPSYQYTLPTGQERGDFLALDVGGSTFRLALIRLDGKKHGGDGLQVRRTRKFEIGEKIRNLQGEAFFDWMADRIGDMLKEYNHINGTSNAKLQMGLAWSFPVEQTSPRSGRLLAMGKGFCATHGVEGQDLSELIMRSCNRRGLNVEMRAIVNDGAATLLSQAYRDPTTRMSLILGTGTNACVFFPVSALGPEKFGDRPESWYAEAKHVLVNTEVSMVGKNVLPTTKWDEDLNQHHRLPDFQPLEYLTTGRYLGEIVRLILIDAITSADLFKGDIPSGLESPYTLDTRILAAFENGQSLESASKTFLKTHPLPSTYVPTPSEWSLVRSVTEAVTHRAAAYLATALHALWRIRTQLEGLQPDSAAPVTIACHGTIAELYPGYRKRCQGFLDALCERSGASPGAVMLEVAPDSSIFGAAVAVGCMVGKEG